MPNTGLHGPHALNANKIDAVVSKSIGAYALGKEENGTFYVSYVGRSDNDLNSRLKSWAGKYSHFKYGHYSTTKAAFEKECQMFHDFGGTAKLDNDVHPARPSGSSHRCPVGNCLD